VWSEWKKVAEQKNKRRKKSSQVNLKPVDLAAASKSIKIHI
jgi:hypothetical protein